MKNTEGEILSDLRVDWLPTGSISSQISSLPELFTEWFLYDSTTVTTVDSFIAKNQLADILSLSEFMALICGQAYLSDSMLTLLSAILPFKITENKLRHLNFCIEKSGGIEIHPNSDIVYKKTQEILRQRAQNLREQTKERKHQYYIENRETLREKSRQYSHDHPEKGAARCRAYYIKHRDAILAYHAEYRNNNADMIKARKKKYYQANKEYINNMARQYRKEHAEKIKENKHNYYIANKERLYTKARQRVQKDREKVAEYQKQYYERNRAENLARATKYRQENAEAVSACKKKCYQAKKAEYLATNRKYYEANRTNILEHLREMRKKNKERNNIAKSVCPTYLSALQMRHDSRDKYLEIFGQRDLVSFAIKTCPALQEMNFDKCAFCNNTINPHDMCAMQKITEMPQELIDSVHNFVAMIKDKAKTR